MGVLLLLLLLLLSLLLLLLLLSSLSFRLLLLLLSLSLLFLLLFLLQSFFLIVVPLVCCRSRCYTSRSRCLAIGQALVVPLLGFARDVGAGWSESTQEAARPVFPSRPPCE